MKLFRALKYQIPIWVRDFIDAVSKWIARPKSIKMEDKCAEENEKIKIKG